MLLVDVNGLQTGTLWRHRRRWQACHACLVGFKGRPGATPRAITMSFDVKITRWHAVAHWTWDAGEPGDVCGICRMAYEGCPPDGEGSKRALFELLATTSASVHFFSF